MGTYKNVTAVFLVEFLRSLMPKEVTQSIESVEDLKGRNKRSVGFCITLLLWIQFNFKFTCHRLVFWTRSQVTMETNGRNGLSS